MPVGNELRQLRTGLCVEQEDLACKVAEVICARGADRDDVVAGCHRPPVAVIAAALVGRCWQQFPHQRSGRVEHVRFAGVLADPGQWAFLRGADHHQGAERGDGQAKQITGHPVG